MLLNFKVKNFLSFKNETQFSMIANKDIVLENSLFKFKDIRLKKNALVFGPNGSGKSNLVKAIALLKFLVINSKDFEKDEKFMESPFKLDSNFGNNKPIEFTVEFLKNEIIYEYYLKISTKKKGEYKFTIEQERLSKNRKIVFSFFEPKNSKNKFQSSSLKKKVDNRADTKNRNMLLLSYIREKNFDDFDEIYDWFNNNLEVHIRHIPYSNRILSDVEDELEDDLIRLKVLEYLNKYSFSRIHNIRVIKSERDVKKIIEKMKEKDIFSDNFLQEMIKEKETKKIKIIHKDEKNNNIEFDLSNEESFGTKKFIEILVFVLKAMKEKKIIFIDEIEDSLHPALLKEVFSLINETDGEIQVIGSTHAYPLLLYVNDEDEIFRRDQIFFTRLLKDQSTQLYSLINIGGIRKDLKIFKAYFDGRLEAFPIVEDEK